MADKEAGGFGERELAYRERLLAEAERIVHLGSWMWSTETGHIRWSDELFRIFGLTPRSTEPTVERFFGGIHPDDRARVEGVTQRGLASGVLESVEFRIVRPGGDVRHVRMDAALVREGDTTHVVGSVLDITERLELEARLRHAQKMEAVGTLAGGVAHDFNNYLQVIFGNVDLLLADADVDRTVRESLGQVRDAAQRCQRLTRQLLEFGRRQVLANEIVLVDELLDRAEPMLNAVAGDRIRLRRVRSRTSMRVACDVSAIEQVLVNLVANARDAMPRGGRITLDTELRVIVDDGARIAPGRYACICVGDEGEGMDPDVLARVFEPFFTTKAPGHGTGLGLATAWGIAEQSGGTITMVSVPGRGTTASLLLPLVAPSETLSEDRPAAPQQVLLVEDQPQVRRLVRFMLEADGHAVLEAEHGLDALRILNSRDDVALLLTDVAMPEMTGLELARRCPGVPTVLMSGHFDPECEASGWRLLRKPFERGELLAVVSDELAKARALNPSR